jgi:hypothetical protein
MQDGVSKKFTNCKKRKIGEQLQVDSNLARYHYLTLLLLILSLRITEITPIGSETSGPPGNKAWKEVGLGCGYKRNAKYVEKGADYSASSLAFSLSNNALNFVRISPASFCHSASFSRFATTAEPEIK